MHIRVFRHIQEAAEISEQWNELLSCCSASHVPFLRFEYLNSWWDHLGGGEWPSGELFIVAGSREDGELVGIAPLFFTKNQEGTPALMLIGSIEISDYLDLIVRTPDLDEFVRELLRFLTTVTNPAWQVLDLFNLPEASPTLTALEKAAKGVGWSFDRQQLQACPYIPLKGDWEAYLAQIDKKQRHEIRRKLRRAEEADPPVRWYIVDDEATLDREIDDFLKLMAYDPEKERFLNEEMRLQMRSIMHAAFQAGWLQLAFMTVGDDKAAGYLNFDYAGHIWVYNSGLDFKFREASPGWVLLGYLLQWANENGRESFDFMRGSEDYKYRFGGIDRHVVRICLQQGQ